MTSSVPRPHTGNLLRVKAPRQGWCCPRACGFLLALGLELAFEPSLARSASCWPGLRPAVCQAALQLPAHPCLPRGCPSTFSWSCFNSPQGLCYLFWVRIPDLVCPPFLFFDLSIPSCPRHFSVPAGHPRWLFLGQMPPTSHSQGPWLSAFPPTGRGSTAEGPPALAPWPLVAAVTLPLSCRCPGLRHSPGLPCPILLSGGSVCVCFSPRGGRGEPSLAATCPCQSQPQASLLPGPLPAGQTDPLGIPRLLLGEVPCPVG